MKLSVRKREVRRGVGWTGLLACAAMLCLPPVEAFAQGAAQRFPVTREMVVNAMRYRQLPVDGAQVSLAAPITASTENPMLDIQTVTRTSPRSAQLRVNCRNRTQCLPFYVSVTWPEVEASLRLPANAALLANQPTSSTEPGKNAPMLDVKAGAHATLLIDREKVHIRLQVVCLQGGLTGDEVRVSTLDHKSAYKAEIVAPNLLKGTF